MGDMEMARVRREELLREAEEGRFAQEAPGRWADYRSRVNVRTGAWGRFRAWYRRRSELLAEAQERALEREAARVRAAFAAAEEGPGKIEVRWGLPADSAGIAELLELNGMPRWVAFEERFVVAEEDGKVLGALRYRTEPRRMVLGLLVVDPWAGEERLARALYAGAADLAREMGVEEVIASAARAGYPRSAGYRRRGRDWRLVATPTLDAADRPATGGWREVLALFGTLPVPFHRYR
jgi:predicted GNAT family acetyltransferase